MYICYEAISSIRTQSQRCRANTISHLVQRSDFISTISTPFILIEILHRYPHERSGMN